MSDSVVPIGRLSLIRRTVLPHVVGADAATQKYDYIIVGAGAAGGALASRLTEVPSRRVLLLEAGPDYKSKEETPIEVRLGFAAGKGVQVPAMPWDTHGWSLMAQSYGNQTINLPRGKLVGGSSAVNSQMWVRAVKEDMSLWQELGCGSWGLESVLPFFKKAETDEDYGKKAPCYHGIDGPISVQRIPRSAYRTSDKAFERACILAGFARCEDVNDPDTEGGVGMLPLNVVDGVRQSSAMTYLARARRRPNLEIRANSTVARVLFDSGYEGLPKAVGVALLDGSTIFAKSEVVLCAGAIKSPQLLLLSGVGPLAELQKAGIGLVVAREGVGQNLQDHTLTEVVFKLRDNVPGKDTDGDLHPIPWFLRYTATPVGNRPALRHDMMFWAGPNQGVSHSHSAAEATYRIFSIFPGLMLARSAGSVTLRSKDPSEPPNVRLNYFDDATDLARVREGIRLAMRLGNSTEMSDVIEKQIVPEKLNEQSTDAEVDAYLKRTVSTAHHISSTCRMGSASNPHAVVDEEGRVHGVSGLRVVDTSIMPTCPRANTQATTYMIAERIAAIMHHGSLAAALRANP